MTRILDKSLKLPVFIGGGQFMDENKKMQGNEVVIIEACERQAKNGNIP